MLPLSWRGGSAIHDEPGRTPHDTTNRPCLHGYRCRGSSRRDCRLCQLSGNAMTRTGHVTFVLGGARSGKSAFAEQLATATGLERHYVATGQAHDDEMRERIARHRADRGAGWTTHEVPDELAACLRRIGAPDHVVLVDCLTLWLTNLMAAGRSAETDVAELIDAIAASRAAIVLISNEVGWGIVPDNALARRFRDEAGRMHQNLAERADAVAAVMAGLPMVLKGPASRE